MSDPAADPGKPEVGSRRRFRGGLFLLLLYGALLILITDRQIVPSGALLSRLAMIESLVERGTFAIDDSRFALTIDKVKVGEHFYCDKLPLLPLVTAAIYASLHHGPGANLGDRYGGVTIAVLTYLTMGLCTLILVALFYRELLRVGTAAPWALVWTATLALGTLVYSYAGTYQNHTPTATCLFAAFVCLRPARRGGVGSAFSSGLLLGLAAACEMPTGFAFAGVFGLALLHARWRERDRWRSARYFAQGFALPMVATCVVLMIAWGDPRPAYLIPGAYDFPGSAFGGRQAGVIQSTRVPGNVLGYAWHNILGWRGLFSTTPVLLLGLVGMGTLLRRKGDEHRWEAVVIAAGSAIVIAFYCVATDSFGGWSYGLRFFVPLAPVLLFLATYIPGRLRKAPCVAVGLLIGLSVLFSGLGEYHPWTPSYQGESIHVEYADVVHWPVAANAAALVEEYLPGSSLATWLRRRLIHPDDDVAVPYLIIFYSTAVKREALSRLMESDW